MDLLGLDLSFASFSRRFSQASAYISATKTPIPLLLDLCKLKKNPYQAQTNEGYKSLIRPRTGDAFAFYENIIRKDYLQHGLNIKPGDTVIDIGANVGTFTILAASIVGSSGRVIAVEPEPSTFNQLCKNIEFNNFSNVTPLNLAISGYNGKIEFKISPNYLRSSIYDNVNSYDGQVEVIEIDTLTVQNLISKCNISRINLLKVDCEGAEYEIFNQMQPATAELIEQIAMEVHEVPDYAISDLTTAIYNLGFQTTHNSVYPLLYAQRKL